MTFDVEAAREEAQRFSGQRLAQKMLLAACDEIERLTKINSGVVDVNTEASNRADAAEAEIKRLTKERDYFRNRLPDFSRAAQADFARAEKAEAEIERLKEKVKNLALTHNDLAKAEYRAGKDTEEIERLRERLDGIAHWQGSFNRETAILLRDHARAALEEKP